MRAEINKLNGEKLHRIKLKYKSSFEKKLTKHIHSYLIKRKIKYIKLGMRNGNNHKCNGK